MHLDRDLQSEVKLAHRRLVGDSIQQICGLREAWRDKIATFLLFYFHLTDFLVRLDP
jgi:hypothetical protein